jgi:opacity protein-like surface antigen
MSEKIDRSACVKASLAAAAAAAMGFCNSAHATVLLQEIYGDGAFPLTGNPYFQYDYIELYNSGASSASLNGLWLDMSGFATEPIALGARNEIPLPSSASIAAGGYYLIQLNNGTSSPAFTGTAQFTAPTPDLTLVYSSTQAGYNAAYALGSTYSIYQPGNTSVASTYAWSAGNLMSEPYFGSGKWGLVAGGPDGTMLDYVGYGTGLASGSVAATTFGTNNYWSSLSYVGTEYAGYPYTGSILGSSFALVRTNDGDSYPNEDNSQDWATETDFTLTNSLGQSVTTSVPEPATVGLIAAGAALLMARRRPRSL